MLVSVTTWLAKGQTPHPEYSEHYPLNTFSGVFLNAAVGLHLVVKKLNREANRQTIKQQRKSRGKEAPRTGLTITPRYRAYWPVLSPCGGAVQD